MLHSALNLVGFCFRPCPFVRFVRSVRFFANRLTLKKFKMYEHQRNGSNSSGQERFERSRSGLNGLGAVTSGLEAVTSDLGAV